MEEINHLFVHSTADVTYKAEIDTEFIGATNDNPPKYIALGPGEDVSVIVRVIARNADPPVDLDGDVEIEAYDTEDPMTLSGPASHLGD